MGLVWNHVSGYRVKTLPCFYTWPQEACDHAVHQKGELNSIYYWSPLQVTETVLFTKPINLIQVNWKAKMPLGWEPKPEHSKHPKQELFLSTATCSDKPCKNKALTYEGTLPAGQDRRVSLTHVLFQLSVYKALKLSKKPKTKGKTPKVQINRLTTSKAPN